MKKFITFLSLCLFAFCPFLFSACAKDAHRVVCSEQITGGEVFSSVEKAKEGDLVELYYSADRGYTFEYFTLDGEKIEENLFKMPNEDVLIGAKFSVTEYTINYHLSDGDNNHNPATYNIFSNTIILTDAIRNNFQFLGWFSDPEFRTQVTEIPQNSAGNLDLYPKFEQVQFAITYELNGGQNNSGNPSYYRTDEPDLELKVPTKENCLFKGWYYTEDFSGDPVALLPSQTKKDVKLYAKFVTNLKVRDENDNLYTVINTYTDFVTLVCEEGQMDENFKLTADLDLTLYTKFTPIGTKDAPYAGRFDGDGHQITGLGVIPSVDHVGLFGYLSGATISNLKISFKYNQVAGVSGLKNLYVGAIAGQADGGRIENCQVLSGSSIRVSAGAALKEVYAGGILGKASQVDIVNCSVEGTTLVVHGSALAYVGGISGYDGHITGSKVTALTSMISATASEDGAMAFAGGLVGYQTQSIYGSYFSSSSSVSASITGANQATAYAGAVVAYLAGQSISNTYAMINAVSSFANGNGSKAYASGFVAKACGASYVTNCFVVASSVADITASGGSVGNSFAGLMFAEITKIVDGTEQSTTLPSINTNYADSAIHTQTPALDETLISKLTKDEILSMFEETYGKELFN